MNGHLCLDCKFLGEPIVNRARENHEVWGEPIFRDVVYRTCPDCSSENLISAYICPECEEEVCVPGWDMCAECARESGEYDDTENLVCHAEQISDSKREDFRRDVTLPVTSLVRR